MDHKQLIVGEEHYEIEHQTEQPQGALYPVLTPLGWPRYQPAANDSDANITLANLSFCWHTWPS